jgi:uncharacterized membrane protein YoaK (UPF0700 family)
LIRVDEQAGGAALAREKVWTTLLLAWTAAFSDAIGFLVLQQLGASFMSGNTMAAGAALGRLDWASVAQHGAPIPLFFLGNAVGLVLLARLRRSRVRSSFAVIFGLEATLVLAFLVVGSHAMLGGVIRPSTGAFYLCMVLLTLAMGLQTSTVRRVTGQAVRTTFITGVLSDWAEATEQYASWFRQQPARRPIGRTVGASMQQASFRHLLLLGGVWACYVLGAVCGGALELRMALGALVFPLCALGALMVVDMVRPFES